MCWAGDKKLCVGQVLKNIRWAGDGKYSYVGRVMEKWWADAAFSPLRTARDFIGG